MKMKSLIEVHLHRKLKLEKKKKYSPIPFGPSGSVGSSGSSEEDGTLVVSW